MGKIELAKLNRIVCQMLANGQRTATVENMNLSIGAASPIEIKVSKY